MQQFIAVGRLGRDPEEITTKSGTSMARFSLAVDDRRGRDGERSTTWLNVICFRNVADSVLQYLRKGSEVVVVGRIDVYEPTDENGVKRRVYQIVAQNVHFCGMGRGGGEKTRTVNRHEGDGGRRNHSTASDWNMEDEEDPFADV